MADLQDPIAVERSTMQAIADAIRTRTAQGGGGDTVPTGQIITMMGKTAPVGYLACDGTVYNIADYAALATYFAAQFEAANYFGGDGETTFAVPDLRGEFLRGSGTNGHENQGSGADVGVHQDATRFPKVASYFTNAGYIEIDRHASYNAEKSEQWVDADNALTMTSYYTIKADGYGSATYENEALAATRPTNTSVLYCIKT